MSSILHFKSVFCSEGTHIFKRDHNVIVRSFVNEKPVLVKFRVCKINIIRFLGGVLAPSSHFSILIGTPGCLS